MVPLLFKNNNSVDNNTSSPGEAKSPNSLAALGRPAPREGKRSRQTGEGRVDDAELPREALGGLGHRLFFERRKRGRRSSRLREVGQRSERLVELRAQGGVRRGRAKRSDRGAEPSRVGDQRHQRLDAGGRRSFADQPLKGGLGVCRRQSDAPPGGDDRRRSISAQDSLQIGPVRPEYLRDQRGHPLEIAGGPEDQGARQRQGAPENGVGD